MKNAFKSSFKPNRRINHKPPNSISQNKNNNNKNIDNSSTNNNASTGFATTTER